MSKERNNFVYTNHLKQRIKERGISQDGVKMAVRNPDYEIRCGVSIKSFREMEIIASKVKKKLVVVWRWNKDQIIVQTAYYEFIKFK